MTGGAPDIPFATEETVRAIARDSDEPGWVLEDRLEAIRRYAELPAETNPLFTPYVDLRGVRFGEIQPYTRIREAARVEGLLPAGAAAFLHIREDEVVARALSQQAHEVGLVVDTFPSVAGTRLDLLVGAVLERAPTLPVDDRFAQLIRATAAIGVFVHVPDGAVFEGPIVVRWSAGQPGRGLIGRTVVSVGKGARASLLEELAESTPANATQSLWAGTTEVHLDEGASLDVASEQDFGENTAAFVNRQARLERDASLRWALASVGGATVKSRIDNLLVGQGSSVEQVEIGFGGGSQLFDLTSYTRHIGPDTTGDLLSKGVFQDRARGYFKGLIDIERTAKGTDSFLGEFAMLLAKRARSVAIPSLEIDQPDVRRAAHSSSVGPIDEAQIFYLMSRGLSRELARKFIVLGFLEPVVARIPLPATQDRLRTLLDRKWDEAHVGTQAA